MERGYITYIPADEGWLYLAAVLDSHSRQVVGRSPQARMQTLLVKDALLMAWFRRKPAAGLIVHSKRGSQYCSQDFQDTLDAHGITVMLLDTRVRYNEVASIKWETIDLQRGSIDLHRSKVNNESVLTLSRRTLAILGRRKEGHGEQACSRRLEAVHGPAWISREVVRPSRYRVRSTTWA